MTDTAHAPARLLRIAVLGTGNVARALGTRWARRGHAITVGGRSFDSARSLAVDIGCGAAAATLREAVEGADAALLAVPWTAVDEVLAHLDASSGVMSGVTIIDPTNPVEHGVGRHLLDVGSVAERVAASAPGACVVKAFNVHPASYWGEAMSRDLVTIAGNEAEGLRVVGGLVRDVGATPHTLGGLDRARQIEELGAVVIALAFAGADPRSAVPGVR